MTTELLTSNRVSSLTSKVEVCEFCGTELRVIPRICKCVKAQERRAEIDREIVEQNRKYEEMERRMRFEQLIRISGLPRKWLGRTFDVFRVNDENRRAYEVARDYAANFDSKSGRGLLFSGTVGTGKTHLAVAIALKLIGNDNSVVFGTMASILGRIRDTYDDDRLNERQVIDSLTKCRLLVIDDWGKEKTSEWVEQTVFEIINIRYENNAPIIITTNMGLSDIKAKYPTNGEAIISRIIEMCDGIRMDGKDWRKAALLELQD